MLWPCLHTHTHMYMTCVHTYTYAYAYMYPCSTKGVHLAYKLFAQRARAKYSRKGLEKTMWANVACMKARTRNSRTQLSQNINHLPASNQLVVRNPEPTNAGFKEVVLHLSKNKTVSAAYRDGSG